MSISIEQETQYNNTPRSSKVFISYSHDSPKHKERVLKLSNRLRSEGIDCNIDQYEISPPEGWPRWMIKQIEEADYVLVVCTEKYEKRFKGKDEVGKGLGSNFEGFVITQELYEKAKNTQFIPIIFSSEDSNNIPIILKSATRYNLNTEEVYKELYARLTDQRIIIKPDLGKLKQILPKNLSPCLSTQDKKGTLVENSQKPLIGELKKITDVSHVVDTPITNTISLTQTITNNEDLPRAAIFTALPVEYRAVRKHLRCLKEILHPQGAIYEQGIFSSNDQEWEVVIAQVGPGNEQAALEVERAIQYFNPRIILFVGVAGGVKDVKLGDVVVASQVYAYESGKAGNTFEPRPQLGLPNYRLLNRAIAEARKDDWLQHFGELIPDPHPNVFIKPIAAGGKVISSTSSELYKLIKSNYGDTLAVEMEGYGFLKAAYANSQVDALVIRGISDLINDKKKADKAGFQEIASRNASAFAFEVLAKSYIESLDLAQPKVRNVSNFHKTFISSSTGMEFVLIPAGEFMMGSEEKANEEPIHKVKIKKPFYLGKYPVTQKQWKTIMGSNPSIFKGENLPVQGVSWYNAQAFIDKFNEKEHTYKYRLASEAEWEYACRAGTETRFSFGDDESKLNEYAWYDENSGGVTHPVGQKKPNLWGLYDMNGNVWEWVRDKYHDNYNSAPSDGSAWEEGDNFKRVRRGGGWSGKNRCRSASRYDDDPDVRYDVLGFRVLRTL